MKKEISVYITAERGRVISGNPLTLYIEDSDERKEITVELSKALQANVVQLKNGDYVLLN